MPRYPIARPVGFVDKLTTPEACQLLGVARATFNKYRAKFQQDFPEPAKDSSGNNYWERAALVAWASTHGITVKE